METVILEPSKENIKKCALAIASGNVVAFPTETVYGLGCSALDAEAVAKVYKAKGRPGDNPLIVHVCSKEQIVEIVKTIPDSAKKLAAQFMPGAITLVMEKKPCVPDCVTGGLNTVAVRMPAHAIARELIKESKVPVCAPSANTSTYPSPTLAKHVLHDLNGKIEYILDGGQCSIGIESTVVDCTSNPPRLLRAGGIPIEQIEQVIGKLEIVKNSSVALCPGMKYKHYAPKAEVLFSAYYEEMDKTICKKYDEMAKIEKNAVIICLSKRRRLYGERNCMEVGDSYNDYAYNLFSYLREADDKKYDVVIAEGVSAEGLGASIINRLVKSSGGQII